MWILFVNDGTVHLSVVFPTFRTPVIIFTVRNSCLFVKKFPLNNLTGHFSLPGQELV
jgi:hypothetical protein